ncbi:MAG TPA: FKBP-type peptidyl-prolyl cis-trans isomerase [bacterium]|jgi:FKBP-type peptidyl-prolyl cis-trans isomerase|nr:FKBP-type peptidyl-prolyl cis-trans isomerase [bacterium]
MVFCAAACVRLDTPEKKAGYSIGQSVGRNLEKFKDKIDLQQVDRGMDDQAAGTATMDADEMTSVLGQMRQGQAGDPLKTGYAVGMGLARNMKSVLPFADKDMIQRGLKDEFGGEDKMFDAEMIKALKDMDQRRLLRDEADGDAYLARNRALPGVRTRASGLQYQILRPGHGRKPGPNDSVTVDYTGSLVDGDEFDSSYERHQPATFPLKQVIPGWSEGLRLMSVGSKYRFVLPPKIAYGGDGRPPEIGPDAVVIYEVELLAVQKSQASR